MKKFIKYVFFVILLTFVLSIKVNAECSYQERRELLNKAKNVQAYFEADLDKNVFVFYLFNLDNDIYVELTNLNNNTSINIHRTSYDTEYYTMEESNISDVVKYRLTIYSNKSECYSHHLTTKNIKKGIINKFYKEQVCDGIEDYKYCLPMLNEKIYLTDEEVYNKINEYKKSISVNEEKIVDDKFGIEDLFLFIVNYWYIFLLIILIFIVVLIVRYINKKRGEL